MLRLGRSDLHGQSYHRESVIRFTIKLTTYRKEGTSPVPKNTLCYTTLGLAGVEPANTTSPTKGGATEVAQ